MPGKFPEIINQDIPIEIINYVNEFKVKNKPNSPDPLTDEIKSHIIGSIFRQDVVQEANIAVVLTHSGKNWSDDQHLLVGSSKGTDWKEISLSNNSNYQNTTIIREKASHAILVSRSKSWWPYRKNYIRFLMSIFASQLRAEEAIYYLNTDNGKLSYLIPGSRMKPSPNREHIAYLVSANGFSGSHTLSLYNCASQQSAPVLSLEEADPGSGISFSYRWSKDSKALLFEGGTHGITSHQYNKTGHFAFIYSIENGVLYDIGAANE